MGFSYLGAFGNILLSFNQQLLLDLSNTKPPQLSLSPQELEANQGISVSPEMHQMKAEALPSPVVGKGIFNKTGLKGVKVKNIKEQAEQVLSSYSVTNRAAFVFKLLDGKSLGKEEYKKLLFQVLKN